MAIDWAVLKSFVNSGQHFVITTHMRPDGDALGSALAMRDGLQHLGKTAAVVLPSSLPPRYFCLDPKRSVVEFEPASASRIGPVDAILIVDTGTWNQLGKVGEWMRQQTARKLVIDHHLTQDDLGGERMVDASAEACGRLVYDGLRALGVPLCAEIATYIFVALAMDTGWFHHRNVNAVTFTLAAELTKAGARPEQVYQELFDANSLARQKLSGHVLQSLELTENGKVCHASVTLDDYKRLGATPADSEDLVNFTLSVTGVEAGLLFMEQPAGGTKISFRSRGGLDCSKLAESFGGGGHSAAAGAIVSAPLPDVRAKVLEAVRKELQGRG
jgi:phosphoesterase RecJ-like protein